MVDYEEYLLAWLEEFLRNKDLIHKRIKHMERSGQCLRVERTDGTTATYLPAPTLDEGILALAKSHDRVGIVTFNTKANIAFLKRRWDAFVCLGRHAQIIFVNPASARETRWVIFPATQAMLTEGAMHAVGIDAMRANVDELSEAEIKKLVEGHG